MTTETTIQRSVRNLPLQGVRILDPSWYWAVPYPVGLLADLGAQVIKVEPLTRGDGYRNTGPHPDNTPGQRFWETSGIFNTMHRNKLSIGLDLTKPEGVEIFKSLVKISDAVTENYSPRVLRNFGLDYDSLKVIKPDIILLSSTGYGQTGPYANYVALGVAIEAMSGLCHDTGYRDGPPSHAASAHTDFIVTWTVGFALQAALHYRRQTGKGQRIDLSMYEAQIATNGESMLDYFVNGRNGQRLGNRDPNAVQGCYPCKGDDEWVTLTISSDAEWAALCQEMGHPSWAEDGKFADAFSQWRNHGELDGHIAAWTRSQEKYAVMHRLQKVGIAAGAVLNNKDMLLDPHLRERGFYEPVTHLPEAERLGTRLYIGRPYKFSKTPGRIQGPSPLFGQHNRFVLSEFLGYTEDRIAALEADEVIGQEPQGAARMGMSGAAIATPLSLEQQKKNGQIKDYDSNYLEILGLSKPVQVG